MEFLEYTISNTCRVEGLLQILIFGHVYWRKQMSKIYEENAPVISFFRMLSRIQRRGISVETYVERFDMTWHICEYISDMRKVIRATDERLLAWPGLVHYLIRAYPSYVMERTDCTVCLQHGDMQSFEVVDLSQEEFENIENLQNLLVQFRDRMETTIRLCPTVWCLGTDSFRMINSGKLYYIVKAYQANHLLLFGFIVYYL